MACRCYRQHVCSLKRCAERLGCAVHQRHERPERGTGIRERGEERGRWGKMKEDFALTLAAQDFGKIMDMLDDEAAGQVLGELGDRHET